MYLGDVGRVRFPIPTPRFFISLHLLCKVYIDYVKYLRAIVRMTRPKRKNPLFFSSRSGFFRFFRGAAVAAFGAFSLAFFIFNQQSAAGGTGLR